MATYTVTTAQNIDELSNLRGNFTGVSWTRSGTTITVTSPGHGGVTGEAIYVTGSSSLAATPVGAETITVTGVNTFTFAGANAGATSGTLDYTVATTLNINGGTLTVDEDTRYGANSDAVACLGNISLSATLGGDINFDARNVRLIPYDTGGGTVPASGTVISQGGASGKLIYVTSAINSTPASAGDAMPASGFIKIKQVTGAFSSGALAGITASATGADVVGWIDLVGVETFAITARRLNTVRFLGEWFLVGTTTGTRSDTYQLPTAGFSNYYFPGVWVETSTTDVYEFYPNSGGVAATAANIATDSMRGRYCWVSTAGVLRLGHDGTNSTGGHCPPAGRRIRIPNIITHNVTLINKAPYAAPNATLATRYDFNTLGGAAIVMDKAVMNWYMSFTQAYNVTLDNVAASTQILVSEIAEEMVWNNVCVAPEQNIVQTSLAVSICLAGGTFTDCVWTRYSLAASNSTNVALTDCQNFDFVRNRYHSVLQRGNTNTQNILVSRCIDMHWEDTVLGAARVVFSISSNCSMTDTVYYDNGATNTVAAIPTTCFDVASGSANILFDGLTFGGLSMCAPYTAILNLSAGANNGIKLRNFGSPSAPLSLGGPRATDVSWSRSGTAITVTSPGHGLEVASPFYVFDTSAIGPVTVGAKTVATVIDADTFTFTNTNSGATSGTLTYAGTVTAAILAAASTAASINIELKRIYCTNVRTGIMSINNSVQRVLLESVWTNPDFTFVILGNNVVARQLKGNITGIAQGTTYGNIWHDGYLCEPLETLTGLSWTRSGTNITVTAAGHGMRTGDTVVVLNSSNLATVPRLIRTVTALTSSTFLITGVNTGDASGTVDIAQVNGRIVAAFTEPTDLDGQVVIDAGTPRYTSAGSIYMPTVGDQITLETPAWIKGYRSFPPDLPEVRITGGVDTDFEATYAINTGAGYSSFKNFQLPKTATGGSGGSPTFTVSDATGVAVGDFTYGTGIAANAKVTAVDTGTNTITMDTNNTAGVSGIILFSHLPNETVDPEDGFKMKWRLKTLVSNTAVVGSMYASLYSTAADREFQYPLDVSTFTVDGLIAGSEVRAYVGTDPSTAVEIGGIETSGTSFSFTHAEGGNAGYVVVMKEDYEPVFIPITYDTADQELLVQPRFDRNYENP